MSSIDSGKLKSWLRQSAAVLKNAAERRSAEGRKKRLESDSSLRGSWRCRRRLRDSRKRRRSASKCQRRSRLWRLQPPRKIRSTTTTSR
jgi:hypothetical protein